MCTPVYGQEVLFTDFLACLSFPAILSITQAMLQDSKYDYIQTLKDVSGAQWVANDEDHVFLCIVKECFGIVPIDN